MVGYSTPFADCIATPNRPPKVAGLFNRSVNELLDASAQNIKLRGSIKISDPDDGAKLSLKVSSKPTSFTYSAGDLPDVATKAYGKPPSGLDISALTAPGALTLSKATLKAAGTIAWTFDPKALSLDFLRAGETLTITYKLVVSDGAANVKKDIVIKILGTNDVAQIDVTPGPALHKVSFSSPGGVSDSTARALVQDLDHGEGTFRAFDPAALTTPYGKMDFSAVPDNPAVSQGTVGTLHYKVDPGSLAIEMLSSSDVAHSSLFLTSFDGTATKGVVFDIFGI